jgi:hypothetical protein
MKTQSITLTLKRALYAVATLALLAGCGGGGGDNGGGPSQSPYIAVTSVSPTANTTTVDASAANISATFSAALDLTAFVSKGTALSKLLSAHNIKVYNVATQAVVDPSGLTLQLLTSGQYTIVTKINGQDTQTTLVSYQYVKDSTGAYGLSIALNTNPASTLEFTSAELINSGVINSSLFTVVDSSGAQAYGEIEVVGNTITFTPLNYLNWATTYTVTVSKAVRDMSTPARPLQADYSWSFTTKAAPVASIDGANPVGIDANPILPIWVRPNFVVGNLSADSIVLNRIDQTASDQAPTKTPVDVTLSYDKTSGKITIAPKQSLAYLQQYEVTVKAGLNGSQGNLSGVTLTNDYVFSFTTGDSKAVAYFPTTGSTDVSVDVVPWVELNFIPDPATIASGIVIKDAQNNIVPFTPSIQNGVISLTSTYLYQYNSTYTVSVSSNLKSVGPNVVTMNNPFSFSFTTEKRKVVSTTPTANSVGNAENSTIQVTFNFDALDSAFNDTTKFYVKQTADGFDQQVLGNKSYDKSSRTLTFTPGQSYLYNSTITVYLTNFPSADGAVMDNYSFSFKVKNNKLQVVSESPGSGYSSVPLSTQISAQFSYALKASSITSSALRVTCGGYNSISGNITYDSYGVYFLPNQPLSSFSTCTVTVDPGIVGMNDEAQEGQTSWQFTTDGLKVNSVAVTYAYGDFVDVGAPIEIAFNYPVSYVSSGDIYLVNNSTGAHIYGTSTRYGNNVEFTPSSYLDYGQDYNLIVTTNVTGTNGETLQASTSTYFYTENLPLKVSDYGPTDIVYVDDYYWVQMSDSTLSNGFPSYSGSIISSTAGASSPYSSVSMQASGSEITMTPYSVLSYSSDYSIKFSFSYGRGGSYDNFNFAWDVTTESDPNALALATAGKMKAQAVTIGTKANRNTTAGLVSRGCRANKYCIGSLKLNSKADFKKALAGKRKVNVFSKVAQDKLKAKHAARAK